MTDPDLGFLFDGNEPVVGVECRVFDALLQALRKIADHDTCYSQTKRIAREALAGVGDDE